MTRFPKSALLRLVKKMILQRNVDFVVKFYTKKTRATQAKISISKEHLLKINLQHNTKIRQLLIPTELGIVGFSFFAHPVVSLG